MRLCFVEDGDYHQCLLLARLQLVRSRGDHRVADIAKPDGHSAVPVLRTSCSSAERATHAAIHATVRLSISGLS